MSTQTPHRTGQSILRGPVIAFLSVAAALGTSSIYPLQPGIANVAHDLHTSVGSLGIALACGPVGYLIGLAVLVPLVDQFRPSRILGIQFGALSLLLALSAAVPQVFLLRFMIGLIGLCSSVGAGLSSIAGRLAPPARRATVLGIVTAGISVGILGGRILGGWLTDSLGWRAMLLVFAGACALAAICCLTLIPGTASQPRSSLFSRLRSVPVLLAQEARLRVAAIRGALWFFAFGTIWSGLAVALSQPPFSFSAEHIGLYALAGLSGLVATQLAGWMTDRSGARTVILVGLVLAAGSCLVLGWGLASAPVALVCLALFDAGLFAAQVANQSTVLAIDPEAPARFNSAYMVVYFVGGSLGTGFGAAAVGWIGWTGTVLVAVAAIAAAAAITGLSRTGARRRRLAA